MTEDQYNALAAARKYVWNAREAMRTGGALPADFQRRRLAVIQADLAKIDAVLDAEDRAIPSHPAEAGEP